jgi:hypothetical protein
MLVFIALGTFIAFKTPAYESADEPGACAEHRDSGEWPLVLPELEMPGLESILHRR